MKELEPGIAGFHVTFIIEYASNSNWLCVSSCTIIAHATNELTSRMKT